MPSWLAILLGLLLLAAGGEFLVRGTVGLARKLGISPLLAGLTIVGFGTSAPELMTSIQAALSGVPDMAVGNVIGSNIANILLILGLSAIITHIPILPRAFYRDGAAMSLAAIMIVVGAFIGGFGRGFGLLLVALLIAYILTAYLTDRRVADEESARHEKAEGQKPQARSGTFLLLVMAAGGIAGVVFGAQFLIDGATAIARGWGVSEAVIGLTIVAAGTSLPELVACAAAAMKKEPDVALGNIVGSCIYNVFGILGITAVIQPLAVPPQIAAFDIWMLLGTTGLLMLFLRTGWTIKRWEGAAFLAAYAAYVGWLAMGAAGG
ncbi:calcium/sodium antiporter [Sphingomicrobium arenosum]|uniref:calcium/sodium antiporter n=1 Tax=Sphingomicrobium arenosum TaxID=2233861 RepID=UPI0022401135|nr:calcium/sodium antiporter [Sphingomicrobium arenosum]